MAVLSEEALKIASLFYAYLSEARLSSYSSTQTTNHHGLKENVDMRTQLSSKKHDIK